MNVVDCCNGRNSLDFARRRHTLGWTVPRLVILTESRMHKGTGNGESYALSSGAWRFSTQILAQP